MVSRCLLQLCSAFLTRTNDQNLIDLSTYRLPAPRESPALLAFLALKLPGELIRN